MLTIRQLGQADYVQTMQKMQQFTSVRDADTPDELWVVEHPPVFTLGQAGLATHLLNNTDIPLVQTDRGGQITYHGPGQVVIYLLLNLKRRGMMVREIVKRIEGAVMMTLNDYNIQAMRVEGAPGIYIEQGAHQGAKIAALGLKIKRSCTYHGLSINVNMDLKPFSDINPCGYVGLKTIDMNTLGVQVECSEVADKCVMYLKQQWQAENSLM